MCRPAYSYNRSKTGNNSNVYPQDKQIVMYSYNGILFEKKIKRTSYRYMDGITSMALRDIVLGERSQMQKNEYSVFPVL